MLAHTLLLSDYIFLRVMRKDKDDNLGILG